MPKLCCFLHPEYTADDQRALTDTCSKCGRAYGFPLVSVPRKILGYNVIAPIDRGFYSVAYAVETPPFHRKKVLKVAFKDTYEFFTKNFEQECLDHSTIADGSQHVVAINNMFLDERVQFDGDENVCHFAELDFVPGPTLRHVLDSRQVLQARTIAQIAIDLFALLRELELKEFWHNDLQPANLILKQLAEDSRRADAEDGSVRVVAIDLNSASDESKSDPEAQRLGDLHWVVKYLKQLVTRLLSQREEISDIDYRLASIIEDRSAILSPSSPAQRPPTFDESIEDIRSAFRHVSSPWLTPPRFRRLNDAYNAQTLAAWFVPYLIVDPNDRWLNRVSTPGPQVITGMRGCGKTMLLRALQFHARATQPERGIDSSIISRLRKDGYVGIYASSTRLLDSPGRRTQPLVAPYIRLFVQYAIEAIRAIRHLRELEPQLVQSAAFRSIGESVTTFIKGADESGRCHTEEQLERYLLELMIRAGRGTADLEFTSHPSLAFPHLASALCQASEIWTNASVFFLLDDVSTRFLEKEGIQELMSSLLFSDPTCAFKLTTEAQTLEMILRSPGQVEVAREGRDYHVFDLGSEVNGLIRAGSKGGHQFVESVLQRRAMYYPHHPDGISPKTMLGDSTLESIAETIATTRSSAKERKRVYHGLSVLAGVCVGDIGDVISLYERMVARGTDQWPISADIQSECYQDYCSRRLYDLNRRRGWLKDHALVFAEASHALLMKSQRDYEKNKPTKKRLRQYLKLYVRVTAGDTERQFQQLRELIDAGVFVLDGGARRTKTRDTNPVQQFKLTYRKLYGLSHSIGLSERDRFELSGEDLIHWLEDPATSKKVLLRNLVNSEDMAELDALESKSLSEVAPSDVSTSRLSHQIGLTFEQKEKEPENLLANVASVDLIGHKIPGAIEVQFEALGRIGIDAVIVGLGFEDRTLVSARRVSEVISPDRALCVKYREEGQSDKIRQLWDRADVNEISYERVINEGIAVPSGKILIDVTGLAKPLIFHAVRTVLNQEGRVWICRTRAASYYPLEEDISNALAAEHNMDSTHRLEKVSKLLTGETGPYSLDPLLVSDADESRRRILLAFSSPKHERLLKLLDERSFDEVVVVTHGNNTARAEVARIAADLVASNYPGTSVESFSSDDLQGVLSYIAKSYQERYVVGGFNVEFGLTGSKLQAVACGAASAAFKISQSWYVRPATFDTKRFTTGVADTTVFELSVS